MKLNASQHKQLRALCGCASRRPEQPVLNCVQFTTDRAYATDSYMAGWLDLPREGSRPSSPVLVEAHGLEAVLALRPLGHGDTSLVFMEDELRVTLSRLPSTRVSLGYWRDNDDDYPNVEKLLPDELVGSAISEGTTVRTDLLTQVASVGGTSLNSLYDRDPAPRFRLLRQPDPEPTDPFAVEVEGKVVGLVMPAYDGTGRALGDKEGDRDV